MNRYTAIATIVLTATSENMAKHLKEKHGLKNIKPVKTGECKVININADIEPKPNHMETAQQIEIKYPTDSPINQPRLGGQNLRLWEYLQTGKSIHVMMPVVRQLRIGYMNSRISDLRNKHKKVIYDKMITVKDIDGNNVSVKEYSINPL